MAQNTSQLYKSIIAGEHWFESKVVFDGDIEVGKDELISLLIDFDIFAGNGFSVGNAASAEIDIELIDNGLDIPRRSSIQPYVRVCNKTQQSEWLSQGFFYLDTREITKSDSGLEILSIHGYDSMLKAELAMETKYTIDPDEYPMPMDTAVAKICARMGVQQDPENSISHDYVIQYPGWGENALTSREVLCAIAAAHCGNWMMTAANKLRLVPVRPLGFLIDENDNFIVTEGGEKIIV